MRPSALLAILVYLFALSHHLAQAGFVDLPADGAQGLRRAVHIANLHELPLRGNSIGTHYWFGVADDYLLAPFMVGASSLEAVLARCAMFHALCAPIAFAVGAVLRRPLLGLIFGLSLAALPDLVDLTGSYPLNYRTTHWALLALLGATLLGSNERTEATRQIGAAILLLAAALAVASHPFGVAALPAAITVCAVHKTWPQRRIAWVCLLGTAVILAPYLATNLSGLEFTLFERGSDTRADANQVRAGSALALRNLASALNGLPGGLWTGLVLLGGLPLCLLRRESRPALLLGVLWTLGAYGAFLLAGYPPKTWHLRPCLYLGLSLGFIGWAAIATWLLQRAPAVANFLARPRLQIGAAAGISIAFLLLRPAPVTSGHDSPARGFAELTQAILNLSQERPFQYFEAQSHCPLSWSAEATLLDLHLRSGDFTLGTHQDAPLLAAVERIDTFDDHPLASPAQDLLLANGLAFRLHWNLYPQAWRTQFQKYCPSSPQTTTEEPFYLGGPGGADMASPCWAESACSGRGAHLNKGLE